MTMSQRYLVLATALAAGVVIAVPLSPGRAEDGTATAEPGFNLDAGQINAGFDRKLPSNSESRKIPTPAEARAAKMMKAPSESSLGETPASTTGSASTDAAPASPPGPIGATGQTMPAKFSQRNDILDRVPIMAQPMMLTDQERQQIYQAVLADKSQPAPDADTLAPASELSTSQALSDMHALPQSVQGVAAIKGLKYVKSKSKVLLVEPSTRVVVEEIAS